MRHWVVLVLFLFALGTLRVVACGEEDVSCVDDEDCDDGNPCTRKRSHQEEIRPTLRKAKRAFGDSAVVS